MRERQIDVAAAPWSAAWWLPSEHILTATTAQTARVGSGRGRTSGCTGAGAYMYSSFVPCRRAGPVNLGVRLPVVPRRRRDASMLRSLAVIVVLLILGCSPPAGTYASAETRDKVAVVKGVVYRSDREHPVAGAVIVLLDEKAGRGQGNSVEARTDEQGRYVFERVVEGRYTVSIRSWYDRAEDVPCQLLAAKTNDKDSSVVVMDDKGRYVEQIFIKGFSIKAQKDVSRDFDIECKGLFG